MYVWGIVLAAEDGLVQGATVTGRFAVQGVTVR